eukprot:TRINITY_DN4322_c1_g1_i1.p1 TRINITY_DN4322_c1_g1~~TRINITY_DN4322_c1_g1_i1.p1  ORF type:complete len:211 (+),score=1.89 TRINITY_DN4322_c1_g1_i1:30-635(+)
MIAYVCLYAFSKYQLRDLGSIKRAYFTSFLRVFTIFLQQIKKKMQLLLVGGRGESARFSQVLKILSNFYFFFVFHTEKISTAEYQRNGYNTTYLRYRSPNAEIRNLAISSENTAFQIGVVLADFRINVSEFVTYFKVFSCKISVNSPPSLQLHLLNILQMHTNIYLYACISLFFLKRFCLMDVICSKVPLFLHQYNHLKGF